MKSIITAFEERLKDHPDRLLFAFLNIKGDVKESYTYADFDKRVRCIAAHLQNDHMFEQGERILLAYPPGLEMICAFFACVRLGLIPVPVYPPSVNGFEASLRKMKFIADDCSAVALFTTRAYKLTAQLNLSRLRDESPETSAVLNTLDWISTDDISSSGNTTFKEGFSPILFLQYTSGSTNDPKGVILTHENLLDNCDNVVDHTPIGVSWLPQYHDMGLIGYYLFFALKGGTTYGFSPTDFILRPALWLETITKYKGTATSAPNFAYDYCLQDGKISDEVLKKIDLSSLRFVMNAAEPVKADVFHRFACKFSHYGLDPKSTFAAYGLAENTLAVTNYGRVSKSFNTEQLKLKRAVETVEEDGTELMSCGHPLGDTIIKIVDSGAKPFILEDGQIGEIWVSGSSKGLGYWNRLSLSEETFKARLNGDKTEWLRTGDLGFIHENELYVCGRLKDMLIIRGLNYYPQDIESIIEEDKAVRTGCVAAFSDEKNKGLTVVIGLKNKNLLPDIKHLNNKILNYLGIGVDEAIFVMARDVVKTSSGKIRRSENKRLYELNQFNIIGTYNYDHDNNKVIEQPARIKSNIDLDVLFQRYGLSGNETSTLGDSGLDSLKLAEFAHDLKQTIVKFNFEDLAEEIDLRIIQKIAVSELYEILYDLSISSRFSRFKFKKALGKIHEEYRSVEKEMMQRDSVLKIEIPELNQLSSWSSKGHILVTGGTGFFGPFIIKSLLEQQTDDIYVLVRAENEQQGYERLLKAFSSINCESEIKKDFEKRVKVVLGSLDRFHLGMKDSDWLFMEENIHTIYHNGALVNYLLDYESMRTANVDGTTEVIRLASSSRIKILNYISTTFIFGWSTKDVLYESDRNVDMELLDFGYSQSKWVSEQVVHQAMDKGLPVRIFRPALISPSIKGDGYNFDIAVRLLAFMVKYGIGTTAKNQVSFSPADSAANNIVAISGIEDSLNKTFHVTRDEFSSMQDVTAILSQLAGKEFHHFPLKEFVPEVISRCKKEDLLFPLLNFLVRSVDNISSMEFKRYDNSNYMKYRQLSKFGKEDHSLEEVVNGIFQFLLNQNIITSESLEYGQN